MTVIISNKRVQIRSFSINKHPMLTLNPTARHLGKALERSTSKFLVDKSDDMTLNPYSRAFFVLWLVASLVAIGVHVMHQ
ncbi:hypothetical protein GCM10028818_37450 [Spirosoma horti]